MKKAFTIIELIFVIVIMGILVGVGGMKVISYLEVRSINQFNDEYKLASTSLNANFNKRLTNGTYEALPSLEKADNEHIFEAVMKNPIKISSSKTSGWQAPSNNIYKFYISSNKIVELEYDKKLGILKCKSLTCSGCDSSDINQLKSRVAISCP